MAVTRLEDDEKMTVSLTDSHSGKRGGAQSINIINQYGVLSLVMSSRKEEARRFKRWVIHEVLPSIIKTGKYEVGVDRATVRANGKAKRVRFTDTLKNRGYDNPKYYGITTLAMYGSLNVEAPRDVMSTEGLLRCDLAETLATYNIHTTDAHGFEEVHPICVKSACQVSMLTKQMPMITQQRELENYGVHYG